MEISNSFSSPIPIKNYFHADELSQGNFGRNDEMGGAVEVEVVVVEEILNSGMCNRSRHRYFSNNIPVMTDVSAVGVFKNSAGTWRIFG